MLIVLEGNIGAGKSTLLDVIGEKLASRVGHDRVVVLQEPVVEWCKNGLLKRFYEDRAGTGLQLQLTIYLTMLEHERSAVDLSKQGKVVVMERSLFSAQRVFGEIFKRDPSVSKKDKDLLEMLCDRFPPSATADQLGCMAYVRLYLHTPVAECLRRIQQRGRDGEENITEEYLQDVEKILETLITRGGGHDTDHTIVIDGRYEQTNPMSGTVESALCGPGMICTGGNLEEFLIDLSNIITSS